MAHRKVIQMETQMEIQMAHQKEIQTETQMEIQTAHRKVIQMETQTEKPMAHRKVIQTAGLEEVVKTLCSKLLHPWEQWAIPHHMSNFLFDLFQNKHLQ